MAIPLTCACGRRFETPDENAGRTAACPDCGHLVAVPKAGPEPGDEIAGFDPAATATSGKAVASLVLGLGFFFACLTGLPAIFLGRAALRDIDRSKGRLGGRGMAVAGIWLGVLGCLFTVGWLLPAIRSAGEAARRSMCVNNLKQIGLAMHNYHDGYGCFPPAAITDKNGRPLLSWRVAILPFLEQTPLYNHFHLDEPWNSPHNLALLDEMPRTYTCPSDKTLQPGMTGYQVVVDPRTMFRPDHVPVKFEHVLDGTVSTILVGESLRAVPWTAPEELSFDMVVPRWGFGSAHGYHNNGYNVLFADGSVRFLKLSLSPSLLRSLLTRDGGEIISGDSL